MLKNNPTLSVRAPIATEQDAVEDLLADAFLKNPIIRLLFGGGASRRRLRLMNRWTLREPTVKTLAVFDGAQMVGACKYVDHPHCNPTGVRWFYFLSDCVRAWGLRSFINLLTLLGTDKHPPEHHRYLIIVGVAEAARGSGAGSLLLETFLSEADTENIPTVLETDTERAKMLYEKFGYRTHHLSDYKWGGIKIWHMRREAKSDTGGLAG